jgi:hypothetical protein
MKKLFLAAILAATFGAPALADPVAPTSVPVADYAVFVDPPTGFVFVKLPAGWKFVGQVERESLAQLPSTVFTSLLPPSHDADAAVAQHTSVAKKKVPGNS